VTNVKVEDRGETEKTERKVKIVLTQT